MEMLKRLRTPATISISSLETIGSFFGNYFALFYQYLVDRETK
ncbi:MAG: hypothetical protein QME07_03965 [bacterium]|nr:hypothetical protein [bacterium]